MAIANQNFTLYQGDSLTVQFSITTPDGAPVNLAGASIFWRAATMRFAPVMEKTTGDGVAITDPVNGLCEVSLLPSETASLLGTYRHQLILHDGAGQEAVVAEGMMTAHRRIEGVDS